MAMNKAERAELERAKIEAALRWTDKVEKDVPVPSNLAEDSTGWMAIGVNSDYPRVEPAWSSVVSHGSGKPCRAPGACGFQGGVELYSTKILALKAMRNSIEEHAAAKLRVIDLMIEAEKGPK